MKNAAKIAAAIALIIAGLLVIDRAHRDLETLTTAGEWNLDTERTTP